MISIAIEEAFPGRSAKWFKKPQNMKLCRMKNSSPS